MRILLIERDLKAAEQLAKLVREVAPEKQVAGSCTSIRETLQWLEKNPLPDLVLARVQLSDGLSFEVFKKPGYKVPVIFICAFDNYAINAFKANGIDYLLDPIKKEDMQEAIQKYERLFSPYRTARKNNYQPATTATRYQERFIVHIGQQMKLIKAEDIAYYYTENKVVYMVTFDNKKYTTHFTLDYLEEILNPAMFYRINRQFIINASAIVKMTAATKSRLKLELKPETRFETTTSFERTADFRKWLVGGL